MKKVLFILPIFILFSLISSANKVFAKNTSSKPAPASFFEPGETVFVELSGFNFHAVSELKAALISPEVGAEWLGYCIGKEVICIKIPATGQIALENTLKQNTGGFKFHAASEYSLTDDCFITE